MDAVRAIETYLNKMTSDIPGMKVLLLDKDTTAIISVVYTQSQLLSKEIYLIDRIENTKREQMKHLKCISFLRPTPSSIQSLNDELRNPSFGEYFLYFSNTLQKSSLEKIAESDTHEVVREVQEYFADFIAVNTNFYSLNVTLPEYTLFMDFPKGWDYQALTRSMEGVCASLLALKKKPLIRYENNSSLAYKLAAEVMNTIRAEGPLYDFRKTDTPPLLLITDRRNDPITPLLSQWTYQAMIHEMLGITNGRVDLSHLKDNRPETKEIVLSASQDSFFKANMNLNLGDLGQNIKKYVDDYQEKHNSTKKIDSIADMKRFVEEYPEFRKLSGNVSKHVTLVGELSRQVSAGKLLEYGELEQSMAVSNSHSSHVKLVEQCLADPAVPVAYKIRMTLLYVLRYEKTVPNKAAGFMEMLKAAGASPEDLAIIPAMIEYAGTEVRMDPSNTVEDLIEKTKVVFKGLQGAENVYTQHVPRIVQIVGDAIKGKLKDPQYPFYESSTKDKPQDIIIFMIGGATYSEALGLEKLVQQSPGVRIVLGCTNVHNSESFKSEVLKAVQCKSPQ